MLLAGDVMAEAQQVLVSSGQSHHSLVLKVPHHGGDTALSEPFLEAVSPEVAIISVGADNRFGHPSEVTLEKLGGIPCYRTDQNGSIELVTDGGRCWLRTQR
jgi:competence protein ComEC